MAADGFLHALRERVRVGGPDEGRRRILAMAGTQGVELSAHRSNELFLVTVQIVWLHHAVLSFRYVLRSSSSAYWRCPFTWVSLNPVVAAISARDMPCT